MAYEIPEELVPLFLDETGKFCPDIWYWSFDTFAAHLIAIAARKLMSSGYPWGMTQEEWQAYLGSIETDLANYNTLETFHDEEALRRAQDAMRRFADKMMHWWD